MNETRITPAGAGKTNISKSEKTIAKDHPRRCGENHDFAQSNMQEFGSPPQVRGKHNSVDQIRCKRRITPAGAGKTLKRRLNCQRNIGSPPQVRGKPYNG